MGYTLKKVTIKKNQLLLNCIKEFQPQINFHFKKIWNSDLIQDIIRLFTANTLKLKYWLGYTLKKVTIKKNQILLIVLRNFNPQFKKIWNSDLIQDIIRLFTANTLKLKYWR